MSEPLKDKVPDKIALIYEFNKQSPLFARVANAELNKGNVEEALNILSTGLELYPDYASARLVNAKALAYSGSKEEAIEEVKKAGLLINDLKSEQYYLNQIEKIYAESSAFSESRRTAFFPENFEAIEEEVKTEIEEEIIDDGLEQLAEELNSAKSIEVEEEEEKPSSGFVFTGGKPIISETLAGIYMAQGNLKDAKYVYEQLIIKEPEKEERFRKKLAVIEERLSQK
ncbi:MAG: hypothetical protein KJ571_12240 [Bacteroidetes bacterium]|nr:hypothetical protein [Bacteroidota bacterium]